MYYCVHNQLKTNMIVLHNNALIKDHFTVFMWDNTLIMKKKCASRDLTTNVLSRTDVKSKNPALIRSIISLEGIHAVSLHKALNLN